MVDTRSSPRQAANGNSSASAQDNGEAHTGEKRKAANSSSSASKRGKTSDDKEQTTIEATLNGKKDEIDSKDAEMVDQTKSNEPTAQSNDDEARKEDNADEGDHKPSHHSDQATGSKVSDADNAVELSQTREEATPSTILEKGIIYFFFRGRVGIEEPSSVSDVARSYIVLRPLPKGAKLGDGPIGDEKKNRLLALPKKVLPKSPKDRFMTFVEKANISMDEIKETLSASDYSTKTVGDRHTPASAPIGEGVYAITETGRDTHLAYILTLPKELSDVQEAIGLRKRNSFNTSAKNPESKGPASAQLPQSAEFPSEIQDQFAGRGWMPLRPEMLNYENCQFLLIGHGDSALEKATQAQHGEEKNDQKETPLEEVEKLENEDALRVKHLDGDSAIFADLGLESEQYPELQTTW